MSRHYLYVSSESEDLIESYAESEVHGEPSAHVNTDRYAAAFMATGETDEPGVLIFTAEAVEIPAASAAVVHTQSFVEAVDGKGVPAGLMVLQTDWIDDTPLRITGLPQVLAPSNNGVGVEVTFTVENTDDEDPFEIPAGVALVKVVTPDLQRPHFFVKKPIVG